MGLQSYHNRITIGSQSVASSPTQKHTVQAVPSQKKKRRRKRVQKSLDGRKRKGENERKGGKESRRRKQKTKEKDRMKERKARWK